MSVEARSIRPSPTGEVRWGLIAISFSTITTNKSANELQPPLVLPRRGDAGYLFLIVYLPTRRPTYQVPMLCHLPHESFSSSSSFARNPFRVASSTSPSSYSRSASRRTISYHSWRAS